VCDGPSLVGQGLGMQYLSGFSRVPTVSTLPTLSYGDMRRAVIALSYGDMRRAVIAHIYDAYDHVCCQYDQRSPHAMPTLAITRNGSARGSCVYDRVACKEPE